MYFATDWTTRVDFARLRRERLERVRTAMGRHKLDALLVFRAENTRYLCSLRPTWMPTWLFLNAGAFTSTAEEPIVWAMSDDYPHRARVMHWLKPEHIRRLPGAIEGSPDATPTLKELAAGLKDLGLRGGRLGVDLIMINALDQLRALLPDVEIVDGEWCMRDARIIKTDDEVEIMRQGCKAVDAAFEAVFENLKPGVRETEVLAEANRVLTRFGSEFPQSGGIVASGAHSAPMARFASDQILQNGDMVWVDIGGCYNGIFCEATRTLVVGEPSPEQRKIYTACYRARGAVLSAMRPGATAAELAERAKAELDPFGMTRYLQTGPLVHGIGVAGAEPPWIPGPGNTFDFTLQRNLTVSVVPTLQVPDVPGGGGVRFEDQVVVTQHGVDIMTRAGYDDRLLL